MTRRRSSLVGSLLVLCLLAVACGGSTSTVDGAVPESRRSEPLGTSADTAVADGSSSEADPSATTGPTEDTSDSSATSTSDAAESRRSDAACPAPTARPDGLSVTTATVDVGGLEVEFATYPRPDYAGDPWTHWGQGIVLDDGRFVSGLGDHLGADANSFVYVYEPTDDSLTLVADVASAVGQESGEWGQGKLHSQMVQITCDEVLMASYWGKRTGGPDLYEGGHILSLDTSTYELSSLGIPVPGFGIPSLAERNGLLFGEGSDPTAPRGVDAGVFFVWDPATRETVYSVSDPSHQRLRSVLTTDDGRAFVATADETLLEYQPGGALEVAGDRLPSGWLRAVTPDLADGSVVGVTREPHSFFRRDASGAIEPLGPASGYITSLALTADEKVLYIPGAHGSAWKHDASLYAFDPSTGTDEVVVSLNAAAEDVLGLTLGGTYSVTTSPDRSVVYIVFNAGSRDDPWGDIVLAVVHL